ncbi:MAG: tRNA 2-thiouridine(34) synthase MnmA [Planctomycetia bacterium]|nr:tRNA 2-thiouridine(34) synthase MnmA [Planctomycetia bacterium]
MSRVVLAMSGGVDSSVSAALLKEQGHDVVGLFMRHGQPHESVCETTPAGATIAAGSRASNSPSAAVLPILPQLAHKQGCCTAADAHDARRVADLLDIPFYALNFEPQFARIIDYFVDEYTSGRTPNPCVVCNNWLKFGALWDYAEGIGADYIATGHYARIVAAEAPRGAPALCRGIDGTKDQAYVLFGIDRNLLPKLVFPVGTLKKSEVRSRACELGLRVADKKDSQEICFVPDHDYARFVREKRRADTSGEIVTTSGRVVGRHEGLENFTVGQRKGLRVAMGERYFVVRIEPATRRVVIGTRDELAVREFFAKGANWLIDDPQGEFRCDVKIRYLSTPVSATVTPLSGGRIHFALDEPKHGVAPGQAAVCFDGDRVLGGGWIE